MKNMKSDFNRGAVYARDCIVCNIIGMQNSYGENSDKYQALQELLEHIIKSYGDYNEPFKG